MGVGMDGRHAYRSPSSGQVRLFDVVGGMAMVPVADLDALMLSTGMFNDVESDD